ncbi:hypothetical protein OC842_005599 [Tilletia horrida]|uniref:Uncharacterized protein n=1 Tax=Tilletia horrida TaxID=155126 RepID=A0AAN6JIU9_9BASI|nr:hypothetical protein OC842_005599 [Tilletia horrida]
MCHPVHLSDPSSWPPASQKYLSTYASAPAASSSSSSFAPTSSATLPSAGSWSISAADEPMYASQASSLDLMTQADNLALPPSSQDSASSYNRALNFPNYYGESARTGALAATQGDGHPDDDNDDDVNDALYDPPSPAASVKTEPEFPDELLSQLDIPRQKSKSSSNFSEYIHCSQSTASDFPCSQADSHTDTEEVRTVAVKQERTEQELTLAQSSTLTHTYTHSLVLSNAAIKTESRESQVIQPLYTLAVNQDEPAWPAAGQSFRAPPMLAPATPDLEVDPLLRQAPHDEAHDDAGLMVPRPPAASMLPNDPLHLAFFHTILSAIDRTPAVAPACIGPSIGGDAPSSDVAEVQHLRQLVCDRLTQCKSKREAKDRKPTGHHVKAEKVFADDEAPLRLATATDLFGGGACAVCRRAGKTCIVCPRRHTKCFDCVVDGLTCDNKLRASTKSAEDKLARASRPAQGRTRQIRKAISATLAPSAAPAPAPAPAPAAAPAPAPQHFAAVRGLLQDVQTAANGRDDLHGVSKLLVDSGRLLSPEKVGELRAGTRVGV